MARKRIGMKKIRELICLKTITEMSDRKIARALNISRPAVAKYWQGFNSSGLLPEQIEKMADSELLRMVEKTRIEASNKHQQLIQYFPHFVIELQRTGATLHLLWQEYKQKHSEGFLYSQFCHHFLIWRKSSEVRMHINQKAGDKVFVDYAGDKVFVDYAGDKLAYIDRKNGKEIPAEVFVAILGASGLTYAEGSVSQ